MVVAVVQVGYDEGMYKHFTWLVVDKRADLKNAFELEVVRIYMCGVKDREQLKAILR